MKRTKKIFCLLIALVLSFGLLPATAVPTFAASNVVFVNSTGDDSAGDGSLGAPYATIAKAYEVALDGDTIGVLSNLTLSSTIGLAKDITIRAYDYFGTPQDTYKPWLITRDAGFTGLLFSVQSGTVNFISINIGSSGGAAGIFDVNVESGGSANLIGSTIVYNLDVQAGGLAMIEPSAVGRLKLEDNATGVTMKFGTRSNMVNDTPSTSITYGLNSYVQLADTSSPGGVKILYPTDNDGFKDGDVLFDGTSAGFSDVGLVPLTANLILSDDKSLSLKIVVDGSRIVVGTKHPIAVDVSPAAAGNAWAYARGTGGPGGGVPEAFAWDSVNLTASTGTGYTFTGWTSSDNSIAFQETYSDVNTNNSTFNMPNKEVTVTANFALIPPAITSVDAASVTSGLGGTFQVVATGGGTITYTLSNDAPAGVSIDPSTGLITVAGTVAEGSHNFTVTASNGTTDAVQPFTLAVNAPSGPPEFTSFPSTSVTSGEGGTYQVSATGGGTITYSLAGAPTGVSIDTSTGIITVADTVAAGYYPFTVKASNDEGDVTQDFGLSVVQGSVIFFVNPPGSGSPKASPAKAAAGESVTLTANPNAGYKFMMWSSSVILPGDMFNASVTFTMPSNSAVPITVFYSALPKITSADSASVTSGSGGTFQVTATTGSGTITYSLTGAPAGVSINSSTGLITVAGTVGAGSYPFTVTASNGTPADDATQSFTLTVNAAGGGGGTVPAPGFGSTPTAQPGTQPGTTKVTGVTAGAGNQLKVLVTSGSTPKPNVGDAVPGGASSYTAGNDISGVDATANKYIALYEVDSSGKVVKFSEITLSSGDINSGSSGGGTVPAPALTADNSDNDTDHSIEITFTDDATWREAITEVSVNGTALSANDYAITAGKLTIYGDVLSGGTHTITVKATGYGNTGVTQSVNLPGMPANPHGLTAAAGNGFVNLTWDEVSGAAFYNVYVSETSHGYDDEEYTIVTGATDYQATHLTNGKKYYFVVKAGSGSGLSAASNEAEGIPATVPNAPTNVTAVAGNGQATISFTPPVDDGGNPITKYIVTAHPGGKTAEGTKSPIKITDLTNGTSYTFTVQAINSAGSSAASVASSAVVPRSSSGGSGSGDSGSGSGGSNGGGANGGTTSPSGGTNEEAVIVLVNGKEENAGTATTGKRNDQTLLTIAVDQKKLDEKLAAEGQGAVVTIPVKSQSDVIVGELNGQMVKNMENKEAVLVLQTDNAAYTIPAHEINIDAIFAQLGKPANLADIKVRIEISASTAETVKLAENSAAKGTFSLVMPPLEFNITAAYGSQTVSVTKFNAYVERTVAIPDGIDPNKITTGVVIEADGSVRHVPTQVTKNGAKYFAKINSLTNSTYAVVWNPIEFSDVAKHWAKSAVNDMGSRMVIDGTGGGKFTPNRDITRAEFAAILVRGLGLKPESGATAFSDVKASDWYSGVINTAYAYQLIDGFQDGTFRPQDKITREQAMLILSKAMTLTGLADTLSAQSANAALNPYADASKVAKWAQNGVADTVQAAIVTGRSADTLAPKANMTRAEVAAIVQRLLQKSELIEIR